MKIKEIIEQLSKLDQEKEVCILLSDGIQTSKIDTVSENENRVFIVEGK